MGIPPTCEGDTLVLSQERRGTSRLYGGDISISSTPLGPQSRLNRPQADPPLPVGPDADQKSLLFMPAANSDFHHNTRRTQIEELLQ